MILKKTCFLAPGTERMSIFVKTKTHYEENHFDLGNHHSISKLRDS
jgi:hypothetical protein